MYRAARLWLPTRVGAIAAGAFFGLSAMLTYQAWYHINIVYGTVFLPLTLEAAVRLRRGPTIGRGVILGVVLGASALVNQESAVMAVILAVLALIPWLLAARARSTALTRLRVVAVGAVTARRGGQPAAGGHGPAGARGRDRRSGDVATGTPPGSPTCPACSRPRRGSSTTG